MTLTEAKNATGWPIALFRPIGRGRFAPANATAVMLAKGKQHLKGWRLDEIASCEAVAVRFGESE